MHLHFSMWSFSCPWHTKCNFIHAAGVFLDDKSTVKQCCFPIWFLPCRNSSHQCATEDSELIAQAHYLQVLLLRDSLFAHHTLPWVFQASPDSHSSRKLSMLLCHSPFHPFLLCYTRDTVSLTGSSAGHWTGKRHSAAGVSSVPDWDSVGCRWKAKPSKEHYHPSGTSASLSTTDLV